MGVRVRYSDGSERWCESCADPNDNGGGSVVQGGTEHTAGGGSLASSDAQAPNSASQGPGGNGPAGTQAAAATSSDAASKAYGSFYPGLNGIGNPTSTTPGLGPTSTPGLNAPANGNNPTMQAPNSSPSTPGSVFGAAPANPTPAANQEFSFDPTQPSRAISAGMGLLGLPSYGPAADFYNQYGQAGISQALADGDFMSPGTFQTAMTNRLQGVQPNMDAGAMIRSLMGGESLANQQTGAHPQQSDPESMARAAYIARNENDPNALAGLLAGGLTGKGVNMSGSMSNLLGAFMSNIATKRFNSAVPQNDTLGFLGKLLGF